MPVLVGAPVSVCDTVPRVEVEPRDQLVHAEDLDWNVLRVRVIVAELTPAALAPAVGVISLDGARRVATSGDARHPVKGHRRRCQGIGGRSDAELPPATRLARATRSSFIAKFSDSARTALSGFDCRSVGSCL